MPTPPEQAPMDKQPDTHEGSERPETNPPTHPSTDPPSDPPSGPPISQEDKALVPYMKGFKCMIVMGNSSVIYQRPLGWVGPFSFKLDDPETGHEIKKTDCIGVFSPTMVLTAKRGGPFERTPEQPKKRKSHKIFQTTPQYDLVGAVCHVALCNGWSFQGLITRASKYMLTLQCEHANPQKPADSNPTQSALSDQPNQPAQGEATILFSWANIYLHAITDLQILHPVGAHPDSVYWLQVFKLPPKERAEIPRPPARTVPFAEMPLEDSKQERLKKIFQRRYVVPPTKTQKPDAQPEPQTPKKSDKKSDKKSEVQE